MTNFPIPTLPPTPSPFVSFTLKPRRLIVNMAPPSSASDPSSSLNPFAHNTVDYTLDHTCVHSPIKPDTAGDLAILARTHARAEEAMRACAIQILQQPIEMLKTGVVHDKELCAQSHGVSGSTVGKHLRQ